MTKKRIVALLGGLVFLSGLMTFFGIPGVIPAISGLLKPKLEDVVFCRVKDQDRCGDVLLSKAPSAAVVTANRLTLGDDITLPTGTVIIANEIDLGGRVLRADSPLAIFAREIRNGQVRVTTPPPSRSIGPKDGGDGVNGGVVLSAFGTVSSTIRFELGGGDGTPGSQGPAGADGRDGRCGAGSYRGAHTGGDGGNGGAGGNAGSGGAIDLLFGVGLVSRDQLATAAGSPGAGGAGGSQGRGGGGCTGLGGSQENENDGRPGATGAQGSAGSSGTSNVIGPNLAAAIRLSAAIIEAPPKSFDDARLVVGRFLSH